MKQQSGKSLYIYFDILQIIQSSNSCIEATLTLQGESLLNCIVHERVRERLLYRFGLMELAVL